MPLRVERAMFLTGKSGRRTSKRVLVLTGWHVCLSFWGRKLNTLCELAPEGLGACARGGEGRLDWKVGAAA